MVLQFLTRIPEGFLFNADTSVCVFLTSVDFHEGTPSVEDIQPKRSRPSAIIFTSVWKAYARGTPNIHDNSQDPEKDHAEAEVVGLPNGFSILEDWRGKYDKS